MSSTGILLGGLGAVIGGVFGGGPGGAMIGWQIGFGLGSIIDPIKPDQPPQEDFAINRAADGTPINDLLGSQRISSSNIFWECCERLVQAGGKDKGKSDETQGYFHSWALAICMGPVDTLFTVMVGDKVVWSGELNRPAAGGEETITLGGVMGNSQMTFYFGTDDQIANATLGSNLTDPTLNPPYRGLCWAYFDDAFIGTRAIPSMTFVLKKSPVLDFNVHHAIDYWDYNPAHALYYVFNNMMELPESFLSETDFSTIADTLHIEGHGISILFNQAQGALTYVEQILAHADGIMRYDSDGKFHPKLLRGDAAIASLPSFDENVMLEKPQMTRPSWFDTLNETRVQYVRRFKKDCFMDDYIAPTWDPDNPETIARNSSVAINILNGAAPFTWEVEGTGFNFASNITFERTNALMADITGCGTATITVTDVCGNKITEIGSIVTPGEENYIRCTTGEWVEIDPECVLDDTPDTYWYSAPYHYSDKVVGRYKQQNQYEGAGGGGPGTTCETDYPPLEPFCNNGGYEYCGDSIAPIAELGGAPCTCITISPTEIWWYWIQGVRLWEWQCS